MTEPPRPPGDGSQDPNQPPYIPPPSAPYTPPPQAGYGPPGGYPPGGYPPPGYASSDDKTWALIATFGSALFSFIPPLIALLVKGPQSPTVRAHAVAALNFQIPVAAVIVGGNLLKVCIALGHVPVLPSLIGLVVFATWLCQVIFGILAGLKANEGQLYKYPVSISIVK